MITKRGELVDAILAEAHTPTLDKKTVDVVLTSMIEVIEGQLRKGQQVSISGIGTFAIGQRAARKGRNPRTGEPVPVAAKCVTKFKIAKNLKDAPEIGRLIEEKVKLAKAAEKGMKSAARHIAPVVGKLAEKLPR